MKRRILVLLQLIGGNDGVNTVIPFTQYGIYAKKRPTLKLEESSLLQMGTLKVSPHAQALTNLFKEGKLAVVQGVGYTNQDFSHFRSTDIWMSTVSDRVENTGWGGRLLEDKGYRQQSPPALKIGKSSSLIFQASRNIGVSITSAEKFMNLVNDIEYPLPSTLWAAQAKYIRETINQSQAYSGVIKEAYRKSSTGIYGNTDLEAQLAIVARLIHGGLDTQIYHVTLDGFDTHALQMDTHNNLVAVLSSAIENFMGDLKTKGIADEVIGMTFSEFGRRVFENQSRGTDHGAASVQFMFGESINGGVYGTEPDISGDNIPVQFDFRRVYADAVNWLGGNQNISLLGNYEPMGLVGSIVDPPAENLTMQIIDYVAGTTTKIYGGRHEIATNDNR